MAQSTTTSNSSSNSSVLRFVMDESIDNFPTNPPPPPDYNPHYPPLPGDVVMEIENSDTTQFNGSTTGSNSDLVQQLRREVKEWKLRAAAAANAADMFNIANEMSCRILEKKSKSIKQLQLLWISNENLLRIWCKQ